MVRFSNALIGVLNTITVLLSVAILSTGVWLSHRADNTDCEKFLAKPLIVIGVFLLLVSLAGLVGACCGNSCLLWVYLCVMFVLILLLFCFTIFAFVVTNKGAGDAVSGRGFKEYRLGDYSNWLQKRVDNSKNWRKIKSCLQDAKVCRSLQNKNATYSEFLSENLSATQSGCCKPPLSCNFTYVNETSWIKPPGYTSPGDADCNTWQNDGTTLCYDCDSCKAGVLANIKHDWKKVAIANVIFLVFLIVVYSVGCCAFRNNREHNSYVRTKAYPSYP